MPSATIEIREGVWTPYAAVLCARDANAHWLDASARLTGPRDEHEALTTCDECGVQIAVEAGVAAEHNLMLRLKAAGFNANMHQTGGMCSAAGIDLNEDGEDHLLITDSEETDEDCASYGNAFQVAYFPYATNPETGGVGLGRVEPDHMVDFVRDIVDRYNAGQRVFDGEAW
jgi:hypothetical protein